MKPLDGEIITPSRSGQHEELVIGGRRFGKTIQAEKKLVEYLKSHPEIEIHTLSTKGNKVERPVKGRRL